MDIAVVSIAYNGYGRFLVQFCEFISQMTVKPTQVHVVLGKNHGATAEMFIRAKELVPGIKISRSLGISTMGALRNKAVAGVSTEWVQYLSIDDMILPYAIEEYETVEADADYICIQWLTRGLGRKEMNHVSPLPEQMAKKHRGRGFIIGHSPFRRRFWEMTPYEPHDYPNAPFVAGVVRNHGRFVQTTRPCTVYLRREDSHARTILPKKSEKAQARHYKRAMEKAIEDYYRGR